MQDNSSIHKESSVMDYIREKKINVIDWPPRSPDLNPIENIWAEMQRLVNLELLKNRVNNSNELFELCKTNFHIACDKMVVKLYESIPRRLSQVIINDGNRTRY